MLYTIVIYLIVGILFFLSFFKDREKTKQAFKSGIKSLFQAMPEFIVIMMLVFLALGFVNEKTISDVLGEKSGILGILLAGAFGSIALIPTLVAFPLAANLIRMGAGYGQVTMLITTLTMVGMITLPIEVKYYGKKRAVLRNVLCFVYTFLLSIFFHFLF